MNKFKYHLLNKQVRQVHLQNRAVGLILILKQKYKNKSPILSHMLNKIKEI